MIRKYIYIQKLPLFAEMVFSLRRSNGCSV